MDVPNLGRLITEHGADIEAAEGEYSFTETVVKVGEGWGSMLDDNESTRRLPGAKVLTRTVKITCTPWQPVTVKPKLDSYQCPFCGRYVTLSLFNGLRVHGPREARCKGSHYTPIHNNGRKRS